jgi:MtN3 and saliva related transmembrane protein
MSQEWFGYAAATLTTVALIPQAILTIRTRDTRGISLGLCALLTLGVALWLVYGVLLGSWPIILANSITLVLSVTILALKIRFG